MAISVFELFKIGIGPSSSHTVGPMRAALQFGSGLNDNGLLPKVETIKADLFGSLGATGKGRGSDKAVMLGLEGEAPDSINPNIIPNKLANEENAAGGRVVTAPTNGAAGIIPAVLHYYQRFCRGPNEKGIVRFLLTVAAIGILYKENACISGAEVGCQGEVGSACSMAAGALAEVLGGTPEQVENAAEIGMEHNLGLTCDPVGGLVQIPCIERNAIASVKAINAARMA